LSTIATPVGESRILFVRTHEPFAKTHLQRQAGARRFADARFSFARSFVYSGNGSSGTALCPQMALVNGGEPVCLT
jgi:hypothetical protein